MIQVANLSKSYGSQVLFKDISFQIGRGERVGLVGRNGHGKTTLFRMILGLETPDGGTVTLPRNYNLGWLEQEPKFTGRTVMEEACSILKPGQENEAWRAEKILHGLGFSAEDLERPPEELSGGYQVRLSLAKVLVSAPDMLLLDEPTNYLDLPSIRWLIPVLRQWKGELLLITHDRGFMDQVITHTLGIHRRRLRKIEGPTEKFYEQTAKEEETYEQTRMNDEKKRAQQQLYISRFRAKARLAGMVQSRIKMLARSEKMERLEKIQNLEFEFRAAPFEAKWMGHVREVSFSYSGRPPFLMENVSFPIGSRDRICVIGQNGKGKTTLMKLLAGRLPAMHGSMSFHPALRTGYYGQTYNNELDPGRTVMEQIQSASPDCTAERARSLCGSLMFAGDLALRQVGVLSGGEKSRVLLGKLLVEPTNLLLLDEPTNHLDMESTDALLEALDAYEGAVVMVTHNEMFLHALANRLVVFDRGGVSVFEGGYQDFLDRVGWQSDESDDAAGPSDAKPAEAGPSGKDRQDVKKARARLLQERSKVMRPLEAEIQRLESAIVELEAEQGAVNEALIAASTSGDGAAIAPLARRNAQIPGERDALYAALDAVTREAEDRSAGFKARFEALEGDMPGDLNI
jgi:ATP-binding cassette, subfamily F, member 3